MTDKYIVLEVLQNKTITWESVEFKSFREAQKLKLQKNSQNQNPDVTYKVQIQQPPGVTKARTGVL